MNPNSSTQGGQSESAFPCFQAIQLSQCLDKAAAADSPVHRRSAHGSESRQRLLRFAPHRCACVDKTFPATAAPRLAARAGFADAAAALVCPAPCAADCGHVCTATPRKTPSRHRHRGCHSSAASRLSSMLRLSLAQPFFEATPREVFRIRLCLWIMCLSCFFDLRLQWPGG